MALLTRHMALLAPSQHAAQEDTLEAATPFSDISSRFSQRRPQVWQLHPLASCLSRSSCIAGALAYL